jgi:hypothetical protein
MGVSQKENTDCARALTRDHLATTHRILSSRLLTAVMDSITHRYYYDEPFTNIRMSNSFTLQVSSNADHIILWRYLVIDDPVDSQAYLPKL